MAIRPSVGPPEHPALLEHASQRGENVQILSTFVMISQNRADEKRQVLADNQWKIVQTEEAQNEQLIALSEQILELTKAIHALTVARSEDTGGGSAT